MRGPSWIHSLGGIPAGPPGGGGGLEGRSRIHRGALTGFDRGHLAEPHAHQRQRGSRRSALDLEGQPRLFAMPGMFVACRASSPRSTSLSWLFGAMALAADAAVAQEDEAPEGSFVPCGVRGGVQAVTTVNEPSRRSTVLAS